jgi:pantothenate kinase-related protein Tda10
LHHLPRSFLEKVALHIAKNFLVDSGAFDPSTKVPLILGIWGGKGQGKTFQTELCFKKLG